MQKGIHRKATLEDRFYRRLCCGKENHNSGWAKDKKRNRKGFRRWLKKEMRGDAE